MELAERVANAIKYRNALENVTYRIKEILKFHICKNEKINVL